MAILIDLSRNNQAKISSGKHFDFNLDFGSKSTYEKQMTDRATLPLKSEWTLWFNGAKNSSSGHKWEKRYQTVTSFNTVQDFWRIFNNLTVPSTLPMGSDYHLFKKGIEPEWEHPKHVGGGSWTFRTQSKDPNQQVDYIWFQVLLALIGNTFECGEYVTGVVVSARKNSNRVAIWTTKIEPKGEENQKIGRQFKSFVEQQTNRKITYMPFDETHGNPKGNTIEL